MEGDDATWFFLDLECPRVNTSLMGERFPKIADVKLLAGPARREVEVLVYARDKKWWRQSPIANIRECSQPSHEVGRNYSNPDLTPVSTFPER